MGVRTVRDPVQVWARLPLLLVDEVDHMAIDLHAPRYEVLAILVAEALEARRARMAESEED